MCMFVYVTYVISLEKSVGATLSSSFLNIIYVKPTSISAASSEVTVKFGGTPLPPLPPSLLFRVLLFECWARNDILLVSLSFFCAELLPESSLVSELPSSLFLLSSCEEFSFSSLSAFFSLFKKLSNPLQNQFQSQKKNDSSTIKTNHCMLSLVNSYPYLSLFLE